MQAYPELVPEEGPEKFIPQLYGFKIFGMRGSKYEYKYNDGGQVTNESDVKDILKNKRTDAYDD